MLKKKVKKILEYINNPLESSDLVTQWIVQLLCKFYFWVCTALSPSWNTIDRGLSNLITLYLW